MKKILILIGCLMLSGCFPMTANQQAALVEARKQGQPTECDGSACADKWSLAQVWISKHSTLKIQILNDTIIETYSPSADDMLYGFTVTRVPLGSNHYRIEIQPACRFMLGCGMRPEDVKTLFYYYLNTGHEVVVAATPPPANPVNGPHGK